MVLVRKVSDHGLDLILAQTHRARRRRWMLFGVKKKVGCSVRIRSAYISAITSASFEHSSCTWRANVVESLRFDGTALLDTSGLSVPFVRNVRNECSEIGGGRTASNTETVRYMEASCKETDKLAQWKWSQRSWWMFIIWFKSSDEVFASSTIPTTTTTTTTTRICI